MKHIIKRIIRFTKEKKGKKKTKTEEPKGSSEETSDKQEKSQSLMFKHC